MAKQVYNDKVIRAQLRYELFGQDLMNVVHLQPIGGHEGAIGPAMVEATVQQLATAWENHIMPLLSDDLTLRAVYGTVLSEEYAFEYTQLSGVSGGVGTRSAPITIAVAVRLAAALRGKAYRGRVYLPGIPEDKFAENLITEAYAAQIEYAFQDLREYLSTSADNPMEIVVYSQITKGIPRPVGLATPVQKASVPDRRIDTQSARNPGR